MYGVVGKEENNKNGGWGWRSKKKGGSKKEGNCEKYYKE